MDLDLKWATGEKHISGFYRDALEIGKGLTGIVFSHPAVPNKAIKIYKQADVASKHADKIMAMLRNPPRHVRAEDGTVQLAWPEGSVFSSGKFVGFVMPLIEGFSDTWQLERVIRPVQRQRYQIVNSLQFRLYVSLNLAIILDDLHDFGHSVIDLKPKNTFVYRASKPNASRVVFIDCDGFRIRAMDGTYYSAEEATPEYMHPLVWETNGGLLQASSAKLNDNASVQDNFALAVVIFLLLNEEIHPMQGLPTGSGTLPAEFAERLQNCGVYYAYGKANPLIEPHPESIHRWFDPELQKLFDRALGGQYLPPRADEWIKVLRRLVDPVHACARNPDHWKLGVVCGLCERDRHVSPSSRIAAPPAAGVAPSVGKVSSPGHAPVRQTSGSQPGTVPPALPPWASATATGGTPSPQPWPPRVNSGSSAGTGANRSSWPYLLFVVLLISGLLGLGIYGSKSFSPPKTLAAVSDGSKVQGQDVKVGGGTTARPGDNVSVLYVGYVGKISSSTIFDSSAAHGDKPLTFVLGSKGLISGFQIGVNGMKVGGERLISIPPLRAYGPRVVTDSSGKVVIPANSTLIFDIKLVGVTGVGNGVQNAQDEPAISSREKESEHTAGDEEATNEIGDAISKLGRQGLQFLRAQGHEWEQAAKERQEQEADRQRQQEERLREQQVEQRRTVAVEHQRQMEERRRQEVERERQHQMEEERQVQRRKAQGQLAVEEQEQYLESVRCHAFLNGDRACCPVGQKPDQVYVGTAHHPFQAVCKKVPGWEGPHPGLLTGGATNFDITTSSPVTPGHSADIGNGVTISVTPPVTPGHPAYLGNGASVSISPGLQ